RRSLDALDVIQIQLGDEREIEPDLFAATRQAAYVIPRGFHVLLRDVAQPSAKNRKPVSVPHATASFAIELSSAIAASCSRKSASLANGSKPTTRGLSATKFESALMS